MQGSTENPRLVFLKLGGSLITDKNTPHTPRPDVINRIALEIRQANLDYPELSLVIGHGSGSFGHVAAKKFGTRQGVTNKQDWLGFIEVWKEARALNQIVLDALASHGLPVIAFPPSACTVSNDGMMDTWDLTPIQAALSAGLIPVVQGDVAFDSIRGGTILSTEDIFKYLTPRLNPTQILLAGIDEGVWADFPTCQNLFSEINQQNYEQVARVVSGSAAIDVTGGMADKVSQMISLVREHPALEVFIFSGLKPDRIYQVLSGIRQGTMIHKNG